MPKKQLRNKYNPYETMILQVLITAFRPLTTSQVAQFSGISYNTAVSYLNKLKKQRKVKSKREGNRIYWNI